MRSARQKRAVIHPEVPTTNICGSQKPRSAIRRLALRTRHQTRHPEARTNPGARRKRSRSIPRDEARAATRQHREARDGWRHHPTMQVSVQLIPPRYRGVLAPPKFAAYVDLWIVRAEADLWISGRNARIQVRRAPEWIIRPKSRLT
jgi:hypothetical protein